MKALSFLRYFGIALLTIAASSADAQLEITYTGNNGVMLRAGGQSVLIDTLFSHTDSFWTKLSSEDRLKLFAAEAPFDDVRWSLTTHNHPDHHNAQAVRVFNGASPNTEFILSTQARNGLTTIPEVLDINPAFQTESVIVNSPGIEIEVFHMEHFDQFGNDFSRVQDFTYLVTMGGVKVLHLGDIDYIPENFDAFDFAARGIDAVVLPTFNTLISEENRGIILEEIAPKHIIATHLRAGQLATEMANVRAVYPDATIFTQPLLESITLVPEPTTAALSVALAAGLMGFVRRR